MKTKFLLLGIIVVLAALIMNPIFGTVIAIIFATYVVIMSRNFKQDYKDDDEFLYNAAREQRLIALREANVFLLPYRDIWCDLELSNKYCSIILEHDGVTMKCLEKVEPYRSVRIVETPVHQPQELWNLFCKYFSYNKSFNGFLEDCSRFRASTMECENVIINDKSESIKQENNKSSDQE